MDRNKYARLNSEEKENIKKMTLEGKSLRDIVRETGFGITTIYYQVRKFKPKQQKDFIVNLQDKEIGELIGAFAGDGNYHYEKYNYRVRYCLSLITDKDYANYLRDLLRKFNLNPYIITRKKDNSINLTIKSKAYINFIQKFLIWEKDKTFTIRLKNELNEYSEEFLQGFARGLMDTDGFLNEGNAACGCISQQLMNNLADIFKKFDIDFSRTSRKPYGNNRELFLVRALRTGLKNYSNSVGFSNNYKREKLYKILNKNGDARI